MKTVEEIKEAIKETEVTQNHYQDKADKDFMDPKEKYKYQSLADRYFARIQALKWAIS